MMSIRQSLTVVATAVFVFGISSPAAATAIFDVTLDTTPLTMTPGSASGPFAVFFQLTDGSGSGNGNNTLTLSNFVFDTGSAVPGTSVFGGASGDLSGGILLTDTSFFTSFSQEFVPGGMFSFRISLTTNLEPGGTPDAFAFSILDSMGFPIPTEDPAMADTLLTLNIDSSDPAVSTYATDSIRTDILIGPATAIAAPSSVPEPATLSLVALGIASVVVARRLRR